MKSEEEVRETELPDASMLSELEEVTLAISSSDGLGCCKLLFLPQDTSFYNLLCIELKKHQFNCFLTHNGRSALRGGSSCCFLGIAVVNPLNTDYCIYVKEKSHAASLHCGNWQGQPFKGSLRLPYRTSVNPFIIKTLLKCLQQHSLLCLLCFCPKCAQVWIPEDCSALV